jgi:hypothetical protein
MAVAKNKIIVKVGFQFFTTKYNQPFLLTGFTVLFVVADAAFSRPIIGYANTKVGVQAGKQPLAKPAAEKVF